MRRKRRKNEEVYQEMRRRRNEEEYGEMRRRGEMSRNIRK